jgi:hypothetical protein
MKAIKWLIIALSVFTISCEEPTETDNCYSQKHKRMICDYVREDLERDWDDCYDGNDSNQDYTMRRAIDIIYDYCMATECMDQDLGQECAKAKWQCVNQDLRIPSSCKLAIDEL